MMQKRLTTADCACFNLRKASRMMTQAYDHYLQPSGLTNTQFSLLVVASKHNPISITELADQLAMDRTTLTRNLQIVKRTGFVQVRPGRNARTKDIQVTAKGRRALEKALPLWEQAQNKVVDSLGDAHWRKLVKELRTLAEIGRSLH
jgi:DNA-binding MarR family transcriptional regulator